MLCSNRNVSDDESHAKMTMMNCSDVTDEPDERNKTKRQQIGTNTANPLSLLLLL